MSGLFLTACPTDEPVSGVDGAQVAVDAAGVDAQNIDANQIVDDAGQAADDAGQAAEDASTAEDASPTEDAASTPDAAQQDTFINHAPVANAGADQVDLVRGSAQQLDGTGSTDPDQGQTLTYTWTQVSGPTTALSDIHSATPGLTMPDAYAELVFALVVNDGFVDSAVDSVRLLTINHAPSVVGDPDVDLGVFSRGEDVEACALGSDLDNDSLTYAWQQVSGATIVFSDASSACATLSDVVISVPFYFFQSGSRLTKQRRNDQIWSYFVRIYRAKPRPSAHTI